eukprot:365577-Chlamydomonas_euryale.AAC.1
MPRSMSEPGISPFRPAPGVRRCGVRGWDERTVALHIRAWHLDRHLVWGSVGKVGGVWRQEVRWQGGEGRARREMRGG